MNLVFKKKLKISRKRIVTGIIATTALAGSVWMIKSGKNVFPVPAYQVARIVDGDTFVTKEDQVIRLASIDAPELGRCGGEEAKKELEKILTNQPIYLKVLYRAQKYRLISEVYTSRGSVGEQMLTSGWAYYINRGDASKNFQLASDTAREKKLGIYSPLCTQDKNPKNPNCIIKGNIRIGDNHKYYHFPGCSSYHSVDVQLYVGDQWFCTEAQAQKAGFTKGADCYAKTWP